tara:strand:+ start:226 stop:438 length:213 start_codon:yes stop_codon:yes gene_type:complete
MSLLHYIRYAGGKAYVVKREMPKHMFVKNNQMKMDWLAAYRDYLKCDHVLQSESHFMFCETIKDAEIIKE